MSRHESVRLVCPNCDVPQSLTVASSVNVVRSPVARVEVLTGTFHHFSCPSCSHDFHVETRFGYLDTERRHWVAVFPRHEQANAESCEQMAITGFWEASRQGPLWWLDQAMTSHLRVVFGVDRLVEKLLIWDEGLDDGVVEVLKRALVEEGHKLPLRLDAIAEHVLGFTVGEATLPSVWVPRARYERLASQRQLLSERQPSLFRTYWVDARRPETASVSDTG